MESEANTTGLSDRELAFVNAYVQTLSKTKSAIAIGCPEAYASQQGYIIYNRAHVKKYIDGVIKSHEVSADEVVKLVSDVSKSNIADYYKPVKRWVKHEENVSLYVVIDELRLELQKIMMFAERRKLSGEALDEYLERMIPIESQIIRHEIELELNPLASMIRDSAPTLVEEMELDLNALIADKRRGKIKKLKIGKDGTIEVELLNADAAHERLFKMHGLYSKDNERNVNIKGSISPDKWLEENSDEITE